MFEALAYGFGVIVLYWLFDKESRKPLDEHEKLANRIWESANGGSPSDKVLLQMHQNLNAARSQRATRNTEVLILLLVIAFLVDAAGVAYWQR